MRTIGLLLGASLLAACGQQTPRGDAEPNLANEATENVVEPELVNAAAEPSAPASTAAANPCLVQGKETLTVTPIRAVGTEPFWGARIEGRCVTYSHPEDQQGTRVWTRYAKRPQGEVWTGSLAGKPFELRARAEPGCSDGMSDTSYPIAVELMVGGEQRRGCATPL
jgi:uncharacterized membrane protein